MRDEDKLNESDKVKIIGSAGVPREVLLRVTRRDGGVVIITEGGQIRLSTDEWIALGATASRHVDDRAAGFLGDEIAKTRIAGLRSRAIESLIRETEKNLEWLLRTRDNEVI